MKFITSRKTVKTPSRQKEQYELRPFGNTHRVGSVKVHRLLVTLSYFRPDRLVQHHRLISKIILLLYLLVSTNLLYIGLRELFPE